jgi:iron-sulfur cluster assembly protein
MNMINLTDEASNKFLNIFKNKELPENSAVRFTVRGGGCSGLTLDVQIEPPRRYDMARKTDSKFIANDVRILVDKKSLLFLDGMTVRYEEQQFGHKFVYDNPNSKGVCGCGESFSV